MIEKQTIRDRDVWLKVDPYKVQRSNPDIIPTEYFTVSFFIHEPSGEADRGSLSKMKKAISNYLNRPLQL